MDWILVWKLWNAIRVNVFIFKTEIFVFFFEERSKVKSRLFPIFIGHVSSLSSFRIFTKTDGASHSSYGTIARDGIRITRPDFDFAQRLISMMELIKKNAIINFLRS